MQLMQMGFINALLLYFVNIDAYIRNMAITCNKNVVVFT